MSTTRLLDASPENAFSPLRRNPGDGPGNTKTCTIEVVVIFLVDHLQLTLWQNNAKLFQIFGSWKPRKKRILRPLKATGRLFDLVEWWALLAKVDDLFNQNHGIILDQLCPTEIGYWAKNYVTVLTRTAHWMTYYWEPRIECLTFIVAN